MARWDRAIALLSMQRGRVLDLGCAFGFTTRRLAHMGYDVIGVDNSPCYIAWAKRRHPQGNYLLHTAEALPFSDATFDAILLLDVLEHVVDQVAVLHEAQRVLKPAGTLILSVPHAGLLGWLDSLNIYARFVRLTHHGLFPTEIAQTGVHRHYTLHQLRTLLGSTCEIQRAICTGLGLAELVNLPLLFFCRYVCAWEWLYQILQYVYFLIYLLEDQFPLPALGYHLMIVATKQAPPVAPQSQSQTLTQQALQQV